MYTCYACIESGFVCVCIYLWLISSSEQMSVGMYAQKNQKNLMNMNENMKDEDEKDSGSTRNQMECIAKPQKLSLKDTNIWNYHGEYMDSEHTDTSSPNIYARTYTHRETDTQTTITARE